MITDICEKLKNNNEFLIVFTLCCYFYYLKVFATLSLHYLVRNDEKKVLINTKNLSMQGILICVAITDFNAVEARKF